jgi:hypothetical protein
MAATEWAICEHGEGAYEDYVPDRDSRDNRRSGRPASLNVSVQDLPRNLLSLKVRWLSLYSFTFFRKSLIWVVSLYLAYC